nr:tail fiber protein [Hyphomonas sp. Mor2]
MINKSLLAAAAFAGALATNAPAAQAQGERYIGEIITVGFNFCPRDTVQANGQLLAIAQHNALFALYGTIYGGDGRSTFALPDLRGRTIVGEGNGPGLTQRTQGERAGAENHVAGPAPKEVTEPNFSASTTNGNNMPPYLVMRHCVVLYGMFPPRN